jgi:hypothetical protein
MIKIDTYTMSIATSPRNSFWNFFCPTNKLNKTFWQEQNNLRLRLLIQVRVQGFNLITEFLQFPVPTLTTTTHCESRAQVWEHVQWESQNLVFTFFVSQTSCFSF